LIHTIVPRIYLNLHPFRNNYGLAQRKINQMLEKEGGCTLEELLLDDENCINQCKAANTKLIEFLCQRTTLQKLIQYATLRPTDPDNHDTAHKFPFVATDILCSNKTIS